MEKNLFIGSDSIITAFFKSTSISHVDIDTLVNAANYVANKAKAEDEFDHITTDVNFDSIYRTCAYNVGKLEINCDTVFLLCSSEDLHYDENDDGQEFILNTVSEFIDGKL